ncbi:MAG: FixG Ig-like domain-containing protein, partial [Candidatus Thermoplasmatota archaeon]
MINKVFALGLSLFLLLSGVAVGASGEVHQAEDNVSEEQDHEKSGEITEDGEALQQPTDKDENEEENENTIDEVDDPPSTEEVEGETGDEGDLARPEDGSETDQEGEKEHGAAEESSSMDGEGASKDEETGEGTTDEDLQSYPSAEGEGTKDEKRMEKDFDPDKINEQRRSGLDTSKAGAGRSNRSDNRDRNKGYSYSEVAKKAVGRGEEADPALTPTGPSLQATGNYEIDDDFEDDTVGTDPDGWTTSTDTTDIEVSVSDNYSHSGSNSVMLRDDDSTSGSDYPYMYQYHQSLTHAVYNFNILQTNLEESHFYVREDDGSIINTGVQLAWYNGDLYYYDGSWHNVDNYNTNTWYNIRVVADAGSETFDLYVDGQLVVDGGGFYQSCTNLDFPIFLGLDFSTPTFYVDDVQVRTGVGYWVGKTSSEWSTGSNWGDGSEPFSSDNVIIPDNCPNYPIVDEYEYANYLDVEKGGYLDVVSSNLYVYEKMNVTGTANMTGGYLRVNYGGTQITGFEIYDGGYVDVDGGNLYVYYNGNFYEEGGYYTDMMINFGGELDVSEDISSSLVKVQDDIWIDGNVTMSGGIIRTNHQTSAEFEVRSGATIDVSGGNIESSYRFESFGDFTPTGGKVVMRDTGAPSTGYVDVASGDEFHTLQISKENTEVEIDDYSSEIKATNLYVEDWTNTNGVTSYFDLNGGNVTTNYLRVGNNSVTYGDGQINMSKSYVDIDVNGNVDWEAEGIEDISSGDIYCSGDFSISSNAVFTPTGGNVIMDGLTAASIINDAGVSGKFYNLNISKATDVDVACQSDFTVDEELRIKNGDFAVGSNTITVNDQLRVRNNGKLEMKDSLGILDVTYTGSYSYYWYAGSEEEITAGTIEYASGGYYYADSQFTPTGGTVIYDSTGNSFCNIEESSTFNFYNLEISRNVEAWAYPSPEPGTVIDINGDVTINSGYTFELYNLPAEVAGDWTNSGTFLPGGYTVTFDQSKNSVLSGTLNFYNLTIDKSSTSYDAILNSNGDINGNFTLRNGNFRPNGYTYDVAYNWEQSGGVYTTDHSLNPEGTIHGDMTCSGGTQSITYADFHLYGDFTATSDWTQDSYSALRMKGSAPQSISMTSGSNIYQFYMEKSSESDTVTATGYCSFDYLNGYTGTFDTGNEDIDVSANCNLWDSSFTLIKSGGALTAGTFNWQNGHFDFSGGVVDVSGNVEDNGNSGGTEDVTGGTFYVGGDWDMDNQNSMTFEGGTVCMDGSGGNNISVHSSAYFYNLEIDSSGTISIGSGSAGLSIHNELQVTSGVFRVVGGQTVDFSGGATPIVDVNGELELNGSSSSSAIVMSDSDSRVNWDISGTIDANNYTITYPDSDGVQFSGTPNIVSLENGSFDYPASGGALLNLAGVGSVPSPIYGCTFENTSDVTPAYNVRADSSTQDVQFRDYSGTLASTANIAESNDDDPSDRIHWGCRVVVTAPLDQTETEPGTYTYNFHVKNIDSNTDTYDLTVDSSNADWTVNAPSSVTVAAGATETVSVDVTIPQDAADNESSDITLNASSQNGPQTDQDLMKVIYDHTGSDVKVTGPADQTETAPGTYTYNFDVENNGTADDTYDLDPRSSNTDWTVSGPATVT